MFVLGIHDGHNASAALMRDGELVAAIAEERLSRIKNDAGYPRRAIDAVLRLGGITAEQLDAVALGTRFMHPRDFYFSWDWYRVGYADQVREAMTPRFIKQARFRRRRAERIGQIVEHLRIAADRISIVEHHLGHAATSYHFSPWPAAEEDALVLTLDGSGDGLCATVSVGSGGRIERLASTPSRASVGKIYARVTLLMGMRPWEHEFKVMGLAPYADPDGAARSHDVLSRLIGIDDGALSFKTLTRLSANFSFEWLRRNLSEHRFDHIAGGMQQLTERLVVQWARSAVRRTGIRRLACAGGVFMNVKANMELLKDDLVDGLYVFPSCGDESLSIGAAAELHMRAARAGSEAARIRPLANVYLGADHDQREIDRCLDGRPRAFSCRREPDIDGAVADLVARGEVVARFAGREEWGARALGNRSILADPRDPKVVQHINSAIKQRDFWMPFAPTVLSEHHERYLRNPKRARSPHMLLAFETTPQGRRDLAAAIHPSDKTARAQILEEAANPAYHGIIRRFAERTGVPAVLNTSFNLHGQPLVSSPADAIDTFERSGLRFLALGPYLLSKSAA